jgi:integrase
LSWHPAGYWCKKIRGKLHYFGPRHGDWQTALDEYQRDRDDLHAGRAPRLDQDGVTVRLACNAFLTDREHRVEAGELTNRSFVEYRKTAERVVAKFGPGRLVEDLRPEDFTSLRSDMVKKWGPVTISGEVQRVRTLFKFAFDSDLIEKPVKFGPSFKRPGSKVLRRERQAKGKRLLDAASTKSMLKLASQQIRAMILLGINCGLGNTDCARLQRRHIDLENGWLDYPRPKTGIARRCKLWPETATALKVVLRDRKPPKNDELMNTVFVTKYGTSWSTKGSGCPVSAEFRKLLKAAHVDVPGAFYVLRHTFATVAGECKDQVAVDYVMGHADNSIAAVYREAISDARLQAVADHVHAWLYGKRGRRNG